MGTGKVNGGDAESLSIGLEAIIGGSPTDPGTPSAGCALSAGVIDVSSIPSDSESAIGLAPAIPLRAGVVCLPLPDLPAPACRCCGSREIGPLGPG